VASEIRDLVIDYDQVIPTVLEIPSKDTPYDPAKVFKF
jgi:V-type H+-transporting ATPase subunit F